jgi:hypothetical protein
MAGTAQRTQQKANGRPVETDMLAAAITHEEAIRAEAEAIRGDASELTPALLRKLRPLLRKPIPSAFIQSVGVVKGKPYESTGIKSVQVQMDRLDNVLGSDWWGYTRTFHDDGRLCEVVAWVGSDPERPLVRRDSFGGVNQASTTGNLYKGSFTNAAKPCFARLGPGWEVYVGATDFDPDTDAEAAQAQAEGQEATRGGDGGRSRRPPRDEAARLRCLPARRPHLRAGALALHVGA